MAEFDAQDLLVRKQALIDVARRAFQTGLQTNAGGNLSIRLGRGDAMVIKPSGVGFAECTQDNLVITDLQGEILQGHHKPSKDTQFHAAIYRVRPDVHGIVHVHSPWATGWASAGREVPCLTVQAIEKLGRVPLVPLDPGGRPQSAAAIGQAIEDPDVRALTLECHGTVGVAATILKALHLAEILEETAQIATVRAIVAAS